MADVMNYNDDMEVIFINFFLSDPELFVRCKGIIFPDHFRNAKNVNAVKFMLEHADKHSTLPTIPQIKAQCGVTFELMSDIKDGHKDWLLETYEQFARHRQMEKVILSAPDLLTKGNYGEVESKIKKAVQIALVKDLGTDYFADPTERLEMIKNQRGALSTGWAAIDEKLYGGLNRGEITIFAGQSGAGKSLFLQNMAVNWAEMGYNVVYVTLELSEQLTAMRLDAMVAGYGTRDVLKNSDNVALKVSSYHKKHAGNIQLKQLKNGCTANDIHAYIKELEIQTGRKVDGVLVDYLDLMMPHSVKIPASDVFTKDKYVSEELRNLAIELDVMMVTASQLNRSSHESTDFDHSHISGGISKINTADNVIGIFVTSAMKEQGRYQIQFMKTRSSSGVGQRVDLAFDLKTLRIRDLMDGEESADEVTAKSVISTLANAGKINGGKQAPAPNDTTPSTEPKDSIKSRASGLRDLIKRQVD